jgi:hypothetical protein
MSLPLFLWSTKVDRWWMPWEAWVEDENGRMIRSTFHTAFSEEAARRGAARRYRRLLKHKDVPGTKKGAPV